MIPNEYKPLIDKIIQRTSERVLTWMTTSIEDQFETKIGNYNVTIRRVLRDVYDDEPASVSFEILDSYGEKVDYLYTDEDEEIDYDKMLSLFSAARRQALNIDGAISDMMQNLD